jgi:hypothetical protein
MKIAGHLKTNMLATWASIETSLDILPWQCHFKSFQIVISSDAYRAFDEQIVISACMEVGN